MLEKLRDSKTSKHSKSRPPNNCSKTENWTVLVQPF
nr:MAG TPA: hypothetical protein [Caudoviricetes sp.]